MPRYACDVKSPSTQDVLLLVDQLPRAFAIRLIGIACRRADIQQVPAVADMLKSLGEPPELPPILKERLARIEDARKSPLAAWVYGESPERAEAFLAALRGGLSGHRLRTPRDEREAGMQRATRQLLADRRKADEQEALKRHATETQDWHANRKAALAVAALAAEFMPPEGHVAHPISSGCRLMTASDADLRDYAKRLAKSDEIEMGVHDLTDDEATRVKRQCELWHRRLLRRAVRTATQYWAAALGMASKSSSPYCNAFSLARWRERQKRNMEFAENTVCVPPEGSDLEEVSLAAIKVANEAGQAARLYAQTLGLQELGERLEQVPLFLTLTLPPEWHPHPTGGFDSRKWTPEHSPTQAALALQILWQQFRALVAKAGVEWFGIWAKEPHGDGCPHQHALVWVAPEHVEAIREAVAKTYPGQHQAKVEVVERGEGKAMPASYIMKYLMKATTATPEAVGIKAGEVAGGHLDSVRAQRSELGMRGYGFLGVHGIQRVWQKIAVAGKKALAEMPARAREARLLIDQRRYADALLILGAIKREGDGGRLKGVYEQTENRYGDIARRWIGFVDTLTDEVKLYCDKWLMKKVDNPNTQKKVTVVDSYPRGIVEAGSNPSASSPSHALAGMEEIGKGKGNATAGFQQDSDGWKAMLERKRAARGDLPKEFRVPTARPNKALIDEEFVKHVGNLRRDAEKGKKDAAMFLEMALRSAEALAIAV